MRKLLPALAVLALAGCGYRTRFPLPPHLHTFAVATFTNKTLERNLDFEFTQALVREIHAKTPLAVAPAAQADLVVTGEIAEFTREPLRRKPGGSASESGDRYRLPLEQKSEMRHRMFVNVTIEDRRKNVTYFEGKRITRRVEFRLNSGETARMARDELVRELARRVVSLAFERWPTRTPEAVARGG